MVDFVTENYIPQRKIFDLKMQQMISKYNEKLLNFKKLDAAGSK